MLKLEIKRSGEKGVEFLLVLKLFMTLKLSFLMNQLQSLIVLQLYKSLICLTKWLKFEAEQEFLTYGLGLPLHVNVVEFTIDSVETIQQNDTQSGKFTLQQLFQQSKVVDHEENLDNGLILLMLISGLVLGSSFYGLKYNLVGVEERVGLFAFISTFLLSITTKALPIFLQEREILMKEIYHVGAIEFLIMQ
ncbi:hypothetical protein M9H77_12700 [Catharanthus roseus]|uniref:Uncharacterized protein n=1 Tax=Catharanthus roseus TaxID=4058 RepID=A0ACC0BI56_CATRO|nr:hypothetical protein M9H77_12700 [Catharanthus roseus]